MATSFIIVLIPIDVPKLKATKGIIEQADRTIGLCHLALDIKQNNKPNGKYMHNNNLPKKSMHLLLTIYLR